MITPTAPVSLTALPAGLAAGVAAVELVASSPGTYPDWIKVAPRGEVRTRDQRTFRFDPERLVAAFVADGTRPAVDIGHNTERGLFDAVPPPAVGWVEALEARPDGLYAKIDWLTAGKAALDSRGYRYVSPCFWRDEDEITARLLKSVALVTTPALGGLPALAAANPVGEDPMLKDLLAALGLPEGATKEVALTALTALKTPDPAQFVPAAQLSVANAEVSRLAAENKALKDQAEAEKCSALVDQAVKDGKVAPGAKEHYLAFARADLAACTAALAAMPAIIKPGEDKGASKQPVPGASPDPARLAAQARSYMDEQAARGVTISAAEAVAHIEGATK